MRRRLTRRIPAATAAVLLAAGLLAGCTGGGGDESGVASATTEEAAGQDQAAEGSDKSDVEQAQEFVDCLRDEGLEVEDPDPATGELNLQGLADSGTDRDTLFQALQNCGDKAPQSLQDQADQPPSEEQQEQMQQFAQCMRDNGVDMADPGPEGLAPDAVPTEDPDFDSALETCRDEVNVGGGA
jgi:hypothetical protein